MNRKSWPEEEQQFVKECGFALLAENKPIRSLLPVRFHEKFPTHTDMAIVTYWSTNFAPKKKREKKVIVAPKPMPEKTVKDKYMETMNHFMNTYRRMQEKMLLKQKELAEQRRIRLAKIHAQSGGYSVG